MKTAAVPFLILLFFLTFIDRKTLYTTSRIISEYAYSQGQIDALNGKIKIKKVINNA